MSRRIVFNELDKIHKTTGLKNTGLKEIKDVLSIIYRLLNLKQVNSDIRIKDLKSKAKYENFIDKRTEESKLADLDDCFFKCSENQIIEAVFCLDNFIAPFKYMIDEPFSEFEKVCLKLMIENILAKIEEEI